MKKPHTISIKQPCGQSWEKMQPSTSGRFCGTCQKHVVDFTNYTDEQFIAYFQAYPKQSDLCGRFFEKQLSISIPPKPAPITLWAAHKVAAASLLAALSFTYKADAQAKDTATSHSIFESKPDSIAFEKVMIVKGRLLDKNGEGLPGANVKVKGVQSGTVTDIEGNFDLELPRQDTSYVLVCSGFTLITKEIAVSGPANITIVMEEDEHASVEGVVLGGSGYDAPPRPKNGEPASLWELVSRIFKKKKV